MSRIDTENIFSLFEDSYTPKPQKILPEVDYDSLMLTTMVKGMESYWIMSRVYEQKNKEIYNLKKEDIRIKVFNKLFSYIKKIRYTNTTNLREVVNILSVGLVIDSLNSLMDFFIEYENYENCVVIRNLLDFIKEPLYQTPES